MLSTQPQLSELQLNAKPPDILSEVHAPRYMVFVGSDLLSIVILRHNKAKVLKGP